MASTLSLVHPKLKGDQGDGQIGSSKRARVHTKTLARNAASAAFIPSYCLCPHTTIQAHSHRDDRMATVVSGNWQFGFGTHFEESGLKPLPAGSVYSEPGGMNHFARTTDTPVVVHVSGSGPTDTRYFNPADDPTSSQKN